MIKLKEIKTVSINETHHCYIGFKCIGKIITVDAGENYNYSVYIKNNYMGTSTTFMNAIDSIKEYWVHYVESFIESEVKTDG